MKVLQTTDNLKIKDFKVELDGKSYATNNLFKFMLE